MKLSQSFRTFGLLGLILVGLLSYNFMSAQWAGAPANPSANNIAAPINDSVYYQWKISDLGAVRMRAGQYCDAAGLNCYTIASLVGGGSGVTQLTGGAGITLNPTTITATGSISIDPNYTQQTITGTCPVGQVIRQINTDGTVVCQAQTAGGTCVRNGLTYSVGAGCSTGTGSCYIGTSASKQYTVCTSNGTWQAGSICSTAGNPYPVCP